MRKRPRASGRAKRPGARAAKQSAAPHAAGRIKIKNDKIRKDAAPRRRQAGRAARGRGRTGHLRARGAYAAHRHSRDQRTVGDSGLAQRERHSGRHHQGKRRTPRRSGHAVRRRGQGAHRPRQPAAGFFDLQGRWCVRRVTLLSGAGRGQGADGAGEHCARAGCLCAGRLVRLCAALENLIDNAVKFTETGDVALKASLVKSPRGASASPSRCRTAASASA